MVTAMTPRYSPTDNGSPWGAATSSTVATGISTMPASHRRLSRTTTSSYPVTRVKSA